VNPERLHHATTAGSDPELLDAVGDAYARGLAEGQQAGEASERNRLRTAIQALEGAADRLEQDAGRWLANAEENICALAVVVARHVLDRELTMDRTAILDAVRLVLAEFPVTESVRIRLNPADLQAASAELAGDGQSLGRSGTIRWSADPLIVSGGCLVEGHERIVDGRIDAALERLYRRLAHAGT
jgi:flagellar biosynthesis/type III secretory pathway protein FliH